MSKTTDRKKCVDRAKKLAKQRDKYICQHCLAKVEGSNAHGSHIFPEGKYRNMSADVDNILCMCYHCHLNWWHKHPTEAGKWFLDTYPKLHKTLKKRAQTSIGKKIDWKAKIKEYDLPEM